MEKKKERESGIELLKIIAIFFIVISHVTQTLTTKEKFTNLGFTNGFIELTPTTDTQYFILMLMRHLGALANVIFVVCSSWFLVENKKDNKDKIIKLWGNTVFISVIYLIIFSISNVDISKKEIIKELFPNIFENNWFITVYLIFLMIIPFLNGIIEHLDKKQLFRVTFILFTMYFVIGFFKTTFEASEIIFFLTIYFITAYSKKYMQEFWNKKNCANMIIAIGIISIIILELLTNYLGFKFNFMRSKMLYWVKNNNPIFVAIAIGLFYRFKKIKFKNKFINIISSLSIYIYLIHENLLFRNYTRVYIWHSIFEKIGYNYVIIETLIYAIILFICVTIISYIYKLTIEKIINLLIGKILKNKTMINIYNKFENRLLSIK